MRRREATTILEAAGRYRASRAQQQRDMLTLRSAVRAGWRSGITKEELIRLSGLARGTVYRTLADE